MKKIKTLLVVSILLLGISQPLRAQSLEVVFKNSLWGAGIGGVLGLASWLMTEDMMANELRIRLIRGSALEPWLEWVMVYGKSIGEAAA